MIDFCVCFSLSIKINERQINRLFLMISEIISTSRNHISWAQHLEVTYALKKLKIRSCSKIRMMPMY